VGGGQGAAAPWPFPHLKFNILFAEQREYSFEKKIPLIQGEGITKFSKD
jgi:hypothetical protein